MERRYLAATIAMAATFALFSHAFASGLLNKVHASQATLISEMHCTAQAVRARLLDKVNRSFGGNAEEAQLRVELNLPAPPPAALPAVPAAPPVAPAAPMAPLTRVAAQQAIACPAQRLAHEVRFAQDFNTKMQAKMAAMQSRLLAKQAKVEAKLAAQQARINSQIQREASRAALAEVRANLAQVKVSTHPCPNGRAVVVTADDGDMDINVDVDQLSNQVQEQVTRSLRSTMRNF